MNIDRVKVSQTIRKLAKIDFTNLNEKTTLIKEDETTYTKNKIREIDDDFRVQTSGRYMTIEVKRNRSLFLRNFIAENGDNNFDFNVQSKHGKVKITIDKESVNDRNFEELLKLMYLHTLQ